MLSGLLILLPLHCKQSLGAADRGEGVSVIVIAARGCEKDNYVRFGQSSLVTMALASTVKIERRQSEVGGKALSIFCNSNSAILAHFSDSTRREFLSIDVLPALRR